MADFSIRSDSVNVEEIMGQIRARVREKRGEDYTEQEIRELAAAKLEKFLDPTKVRSDLLEAYRQLQRQQMSPNIELDEETLFGSPRPWVRRFRRWLRPVLKLFLNPIPLMRASRVNEAMVRHAELFYELVHNLVIETTRLSIEVKNLKMRAESLSSRLDFDERRARALEGVVQLRPSAPPPSSSPLPPASDTGPAAPKDEEEAETESGISRSRRRRRRRGRRGSATRPAGEAGLAGGADQAEPTAGIEGQPAENREDDQRPTADAAPDADAGRAARGEVRQQEAGPAPEPPPEIDPGDGREPGA